MKTPGEIKKGLDCCVDGNVVCTGNCVFDDDVKLGYTDCVKLLMTNAFSYIQQLEADNAQQARCIENLTDKLNATNDALPRWISVEERLPEDDANVLVYAIGNNENSCIAMTSYTHNLHGFHIEGWRSPWQYFFNEHTITHWMPLPEPPKE